MSELLDKQVNVQNESLKKTSRVHTSSRKPTKKCAMKIKKKERKNDYHVKNCGERKIYKAVSEPISMNFGLLILQTMKVLTHY